MIIEHPAVSFFHKNLVDNLLFLFTTFQLPSTSQAEATYENSAAGLHIYESNLADGSERQLNPQYEMFNRASAVSQVDVS